jgi:hypothetical protein
MRRLRIHARLERDVVSVEKALCAVPRRRIKRRIERCGTTLARPVHDSPALPRKTGMM